jgi:DNA repair protein RadC
MTAAAVRERIAMYGAQAASDVDLVAALMGCDEPAAAEMLSKAGGLAQLAALPTTPAKLARARAALEIGIRTATAPFNPERSIRCSRDVEQAVGPRLRLADREHMIAVALDAKHRPIAQIEIGLGGLTGCAITPADFFRPLAREAAAGVIAVHNHPSGDPSPSDEDVAITRRLARAGKLLAIPMLDHVIIGKTGYFSFLDAGLMTP